MVRTRDCGSCNEGSIPSRRFNFFLYILCKKIIIKRIKIILGAWKQIGEVTCLINKAFEGSRPSAPILVSYSS